MAAAAEMAATDAPPDPETQKLLAYFRGFTLMEPAEAWSFLKDHNFDFNAAVASFFDSTVVDADGPDPAPRPPPPAADDGAGSADYVGGGDKDEDDEDSLGGDEDEDEDEDAVLAAASAAVDDRRRPAKRQKSSHQARGGSGGADRRGTVRTLSDLGSGKGAGGSDGDSDSYDDEWAPPPELYTGGDKSGRVVRDRSEGKNVADEVFKQAKRKGAKPGPACWQSSSSRSFSGTSRLLTGDTVQSDTPQPPEEIVHNIYFWSNGFAVDDGPLRSFDDPEHEAFLKSIKNSECPAELAPADGRSKVNVNLVRKEESCPEPVKGPALFQGGGRTVIPDHPTGLALLDLFRRWIQGETIPWINVASPYGSDPDTLTANYPQVTSHKGDPAWYFVCIPQKKQGRDVRINRTAGAGRWKEERKAALSAVTEGVGLKIGWNQSFSFVLKTRTIGEKKDTVTREGWIMHAVGLNDEEEPMGRCLCKVFPTPRKGNKKANPLIPAAISTTSSVSATTSAAATTTITTTAAAASTSLALASAAATTASTSLALASAAPEAALASAATTTASTSLALASAAAEAALASAATTTASAAAIAYSALTSSPAATEETTTVSSGLASASAAATIASAAPAAAVTLASSTSATVSPPKKWIQVQVSASPTKSGSRPKRVYQMMDLPEQEQEWVGGFSNKRMRMLDFQGWLTIEPVSGSEKR